MAYQGEYFVQRYGARRGGGDTTLRPECSRRAFRVSAGTDATRVASYNPWSHSPGSLRKTVGACDLPGAQLPRPRDRAQDVDRERHLVLNEEGKRVAFQVGQLADLLVPDRDYFACPRRESRTSRRTHPWSAAKIVLRCRRIRAP